MSDADVISLEDKYRLDRTRALVAGRQALVRLPIMQRERDRRHGLNTAGLISGYRGSPLGGYDMELWKAADTLRAHDIVFQPGLNEDLALTALAGAQQIDFVPGRKVDGVFCIWYGKGPGIDRSGDAIKHANLQGVSSAGGMLLVFGDDHTGKSSTTAHQSDLTLASWGVPILYPASVAEILEFGLAGFAMSRFTGSLVGLKLVNETADGTGVIEMPDIPEFLSPDMPTPPDGVHIRPEAVAMQMQDIRLIRHKLPRATAFARANRLDRIVFGAAVPRFLIATAGKAFPDVIAALDQLGVDDEAAQSLGIGVYKIALIFPLDSGALEAAAACAEEIFFVEEKQPHAETQAKALLYHLAQRPRICGKTTPSGEPLLPADAPLDVALVALALADRLQKCIPGIEEKIARFAPAIARIHARADLSQRGAPPIARRPAFCPGCPHNTSTKVPEGSYGATGIGCHAMVLFQRERNPLPMGHMGAEGAHWIGLAPFTHTRHIFQNLGDGTYSHSGSLAIRAAVQARTNITYKILYNDAVAMTGGQPVEGGLTVSRIVQQVQAEGVTRVVVLSERPERFAREEPLPPGTELLHRDALPEVQQSLRQHSGVSVLIYDQTCAAEKRRRRRLKTYPDPDRRVFINPAVCEGCGDCSAQSNCLAIQPLETELGRKRQIDQSACNKDFSCVKGFCPSFVTLDGARRRRSSPTNSVARVELLDPQVPAFNGRFDMLIAGVGGTGVVTVSAIVGMAARIEGRGVSLYDSTGLSQKGGQVFSHVRLREQPDSVVPGRIGAEESDVLLACDLVAAVQPEALTTIASGRTHIIGTSNIAATADFQTQRDSTVREQDLSALLRKASGGTAPALISASDLSAAALGDSIGANLVLLGYAWQRGAVPLQRASIERAIELNGRAAQANLKAFALGRAAAFEQPAPPSEPPQTVTTFIERRTADLQRYWNVSYAKRYADLMQEVQSSVAGIAAAEEFVWVVARSAYHLMAYKDEYEVARLYSDGRFRAALESEFESVHTVRVHLAPPLLTRTDPATGRPRKITFGPWIFPLLRILAALRMLREGPLDLFGYSKERKLERELRDRFMDLIRARLKTLCAQNLDEATALARMPLEVRGFGPVKLPSARALLERLRQG